MNIVLYNQLVKQFEDETTVSQYNKHKVWVLNHLRTLATEYPFLTIGAPVKYTIYGVTQISKLREFIINPDGFIGVLTYDNLWYYEMEKPTDSELANFDGGCLIISINNNYGYY